MRLLAFALTICCLLASVNGASFPYITLNQKTNRLSDNGTSPTFNGVAIGGSLFSGIVSNTTASSGLLAVDSTKTNGVSATFGMVTNALGIFTGSTTAFVNGSGVLATPPGSATTGTNVLFGNGSGGFSTTGLSVQLSAALTDETGSGAVVFGTSPTFITQISITNSGGSATLTTDATTNTLALRSGTAPQAFRAYNTFTDASNYERGVLSWSGNQLEIGTEIAGSGSARAVLIKAAGAGGLIVLRPGGAAAGWQFTAARNIVAETDNSFTIGTAGANRPLGVIIGPSGGIGTTGTNTVVTAATGATNTLSYDIILYVTTATSAALTDNAGTTEFSGVAISAFTPIRLQPGGKFTGTSITYATGTTSHAW